MARRAKRSRLRRALTWALRLGLLGIGVWLLYEAWRFPDFTSLQKKNPDTTAFMRLREEEAQAAGKTLKIDQRWVSLSRISGHLQRAAVAAEDARFFEHEGFDREAIEDAIDDYREGKKLRGASTISQQLVKNLWLGPERSLPRKAREAAYTYFLERRLSKERILEVYLNVAEWGPGTFGAEAASRRHFGVAAADLTPMQACLLAAALPSPLKRNPGRPSPYLERRARRLLRFIDGAPEPKGTEPQDLLR